MVDAGHLVPVPDGLDAAEAETVVLNGITAWQMLQKAKVDSGQTILVHGANGGVGNTLVQLARQLGVLAAGQGAITPRVAARMPLADAGAAMSLAESRTAYGKVVLIP